MSRYSGKCDLYDHMKDYMSSEEDLEKHLAVSHITVRGKQIDIRTGKNLALYYPYIITSGGFSKKDGDWIELSDTNYIRETELDRVALYQEFIQLALKKHKLSPYNNADELYDDVFNGWGKEDKPQIMELIRRCVKEKHPKTSDIRLASCSYNRRIWEDELIRQGYDKEFAHAWVWHKLQVEA